VQEQRKGAGGAGAAPTNGGSGAGWLPLYCGWLVFFVSTVFTKRRRFVNQVVGDVTTGQRLTKGAIVNQADRGGDLSDEISKYSSEYQSIMVVPGC